MLHIFGLRSRRMAPVPRASVQVRWNQQITRASCAEILELFQRNGFVSCSPGGPVMPSGCYPRMIVWTTRIGLSTWFQLQPETTRVINIRLHWHIFCLVVCVFVFLIFFHIGNFIIPTDYWNHHPVMTVEKLTIHMHPQDSHSWQVPYSSSTYDFALHHTTGKLSKHNYRLIIAFCKRLEWIFIYIYM